MGDGGYARTWIRAFGELNRKGYHVVLGVNDEQGIDLVGYGREWKGFDESCYV